jgi:hypothetical protein
MRRARSSASRWSGPHGGHLASSDDHPGHWPGGGLVDLSQSHPAGGHGSCTAQPRPKSPLGELLDPGHSGGPGNRYRILSDLLRSGTPRALRAPLDHRRGGSAQLVLRRAPGGTRDRKSTYSKSGAGRIARAPLPRCGHGRCHRLLACTGNRPRVDRTLRHRVRRGQSLPSVGCTCARHRTRPCRYRQGACNSSGDSYR